MNNFQLSICKYLFLFICPYLQTLTGVKLSVGHYWPTEIKIKTKRDTISVINLQKGYLYTFKQREIP